ncbi:phosphate ABC transporter substrate-binding protein PstS [Epidermidibacterium keratini]|uniref:Phosphate-binding protein n=1 Tax=Epidermidibacterium keratini TaxID=1891644 RepID=A0A7L4YLY9_9ACTN|nr:phosphate ABC transporter substrate-binding protein PstS [Epidermidibacterium keratini]QHB99843.1 phosphate ABC transporter substrate-binding protein PstS [Epidermidibacterium keratini]
MKRSRTYAIASLAAVGSLALSACSDNTASDSGSGSSDGGSGSSIDCGSGDLVASGSSAQAKAIDKWQADFSGVCPDVTVQYDPSGSGAGIKDFIAGKNDMAGSDSALKEEEQPEADARCESGKAIHLPMVISPIAVVYNVEGVDDLTLNAEVLAGIFGGTITTWNDPAITALNPDATLPSTTITTVFRSKDSGTTDNFTKYLDAAGNGKWTFGTGKAWTAPGGQGAPDSAGIAAAVQGTDGSISYVDGPDAKANDLSTAKLDSGSGGVEISDDSVGKAVAAAKQEGEGNDIKLSIDYALKEEGAYPAVLVTYEITCEKGLDAEKVKTVKSFLQYAATDGQDSLSDLGYSALPDELKSKVESSIEAIS